MTDEMTTDTLPDTPAQLSGSLDELLAEPFSLIERRQANHVLRRIAALDKLLADLLEGG
jgi:hypothetical protein